MKEGDGLEGLGVRWEDNIKVDVSEIGGGRWTGLINRRGALDWFDK